MEEEKIQISLKRLEKWRDYLKEGVHPKIKYTNTDDILMQAYEERGKVIYGLLQELDSILNPS